MLTPVEVLKQAVAMLLPNSDQRTRDKFLINIVTQPVYCAQCDYEGLTDSKNCPKCQTELLK